MWTGLSELVVRSQKMLHAWEWSVEDKSLGVPRNMCPEADGVQL
jgi:hypothetical protein